MRLFLRAIVVLALALSFALTIQAQSRPNNAVFHRIQVRVFLPDGITMSGIIRVQLDSERSGQPVQFKNLLRENYVDFSQLPNNDYILTVTDNEEQFETYSERFTLRSNFPQSRQFSVFLRKKINMDTKGPGTIAAPGTAGERVIEIPKAARKAFERGMDKAEKGKADEAIKAFQEALKHYPDYFDAMNDLAVQYMKLGRYEEATDQIEQAIRISPNSPLPHLNLGIVLNEQKRYREASDALHEAIKLDFTNPLAHFNLGLAYYNFSDFMGAQLEFEITVESAAKKIPLSRLYLADVYKRRGRTDDAVKQLESFLHETPDNPFTEAARKELAQLKQNQK